MLHIIALAGRIASGKSKAAELLHHEYAMEHIEYSSFLYQAMDLFHITHTREHIDQWSYFLRHTYAHDILSRAVLKRLRETQKEWVVLSTIRRPMDIQNIKMLYPAFHLWYVDADQRLRYERSVSSARKVGDAEMSFENFQRIEENEVQSTIPLLKNEAELILENNGDYETFLKEVRNNARQLMASER